MAKTVLNLIQEEIKSDPVAFDAALEAKQAGKSIEEIRQAALDAYRYSHGLPRVEVQPEAVLLAEKEVIGLPIDAMPSPIPVNEEKIGAATGKPRNGVDIPPSESEAELGDANEPAPRRDCSDDEMNTLYRRWQLARARQELDADPENLTEEELDDILILKGRRLEFSAWCRAIGI